MLELTGASARNDAKDAYDFVVTVDFLTIRVANTLRGRQELAQRVGELAMSLATDFLQKLQDSDEYDGA